MLRQLLDRLVPNWSGARPPAPCLDCRNGVHTGCSGWCACASAGHGQHADARTRESAAQHAVHSPHTRAHRPERKRRAVPYR